MSTTTPAYAHVEPRYAHENYYARMAIGIFMSIIGTALALSIVVGKSLATTKPKRTRKAVAA